MFERYTERARRVLFFSRYEASQMGGPEIMPEHLLLGLIREHKGVIGKLFERLNVSLNRVRIQVERSAPQGDKVSTSVEIPFSAETKSILKLAAQESERLLHPDIGTEHLLLGLLGHERSHAGSILIEHGMTLARVRDEIVRLRSESPDHTDAVDLAPRRSDFRVRHRLEGRTEKPDIEPSYDVHIAPTSRATSDGTYSTSGPGYWAMYGFQLRAMVARLFGIDEGRVELPPELTNKTRYDVAARLPTPASRETVERLVQQAIERHFGFVLTFETRPMDVYVIKPAGPLGREHVERSGLFAFSRNLFSFAGSPPENVDQMFENLRESGALFESMMRAGTELLQRQSTEDEDVFVRKTADVPQELLDQLCSHLGVVVTAASRTGLMLVAQPRKS
jgi:hypothetical protein